MLELFANGRDPDQTLHSDMSDLGLHCLPITLLGVYRLQWFKLPRYSLSRAMATNSEIVLNYHKILINAHVL